jgi:hypothetical protein
MQALTPEIQKLLAQLSQHLQADVELAKTIWEHYAGITTHQEVPEI